MEKNIVNFYELPGEWQAEALSNYDKDAFDMLFLEPDEDAIPEKHILWDLSDTCWTSQIETDAEGFQYNAVMPISNNTAMLLYIDNTGETATIKIV